MSEQTGPELLTSDREFRVWSYMVGHRELLLRSLKDDAHPTRVDVLFVSVYQIDLPTTMHGLRIVEKRLEVVSGDHLHPKRHFILSCDQYDGRVVAGGFAFHEDTGEWNEPSHWHRDPRPR